MVLLDYLIFLFKDHITHGTLVNFFKVFFSFIFYFLRHLWIHVWNWKSLFLWLKKRVSFDREKDPIFFPSISSFFLSPAKTPGPLLLPETRTLTLTLTLFLLLHHPALSLLLSDWRSPLSYRAPSSAHLPPSPTASRAASQPWVTNSATNPCASASRL